jgi:hypothetical protein
MKLFKKCVLRVDLRVSYGGYAKYPLVSKPLFLKFYQSAWNSTMKDFSLFLMKIWGISSTLH